MALLQGAAWAINIAVAEPVIRQRLRPQRSKLQDAPDGTATH
jgi:hypothetical protein